MRLNRLAVAAGVAIAGQAATSSSALAEAVDRVSTVEELQRIIELQQQQLEQQQQILKDLQAKVEALDTEIKEIPPPADAPLVAKSGEERVKLTVSGQIDRGVLISDDGFDTEAYNVDNDNSSTRIRFLGDGKVTDDFTISGALEWQLESNSTADVNQLNKTTSDSDVLSLRRAEAIFDSKKFGRIWLGQGWTASDGTSEVDLSATDVVAYSGIADLAGGQIFREKGSEDFITTDGSPISSNGSNGLTVGDLFTNMDGLGRDDRVRYDSPKFGGFGVAASWMTNNRTNGRWDIAGRYGGELGSFQIGAALAYSRPRSSSVDEQVNGSASILHTSGFNFTFAGGRQNPAASNRDNPKFFYLKGGYIGQWLSWGDTAFSVDYYKGNDIFSDGTDPSSVGFAVVQKVRDYGTEFYLGMRNYDGDDPKVDGDSKSSKDNFSVLAGARVKF